MKYSMDLIIVMYYQCITSLKSAEQYKAKYAHNDRSFALAH